MDMFSVRKMVSRVDTNQDQKFVNGLDFSEIIVLAGLDSKKS